MSGVNLNILAERAVKRLPYNHSRFGEQAERYARKITNRFCRDLPEDLHQEVAHQAVVELFQIGEEALIGTSGLRLFRRAVFNAIRIVRSDYAPPGQRTRRPAKAKAANPPRVAAEDIGRIPEPEALERAAPVGDGGNFDFDLLESAAAALDVLGAEDRVELEWSLRRAPPSVAAALRLVCVEGETLSFAAGEVGLSRFSLSRKFDAFCPGWREAA